MDKDIKQSIDAKLDALKANFEIDAGMQKKIDELFAGIKKLAEKCKDVGMFETEFSKSPLSQKYLDLFTEIAKKGATKTAAKGAVAGALESVMDDALKNLVPTKAAMHQKASDTLRGVPGVGDAIDAAEKAGYVEHLAKLFGKKKED